MAGELVKWLGGGLVKRSSSALQRSREAREAAETALRPQGPKALSSYERRRVEKIPADMERLNNFAPLGVRPGVLDLPRICSVRKLPYVSRYVLRGGRYEYAQDIRHKEGMNAVGYTASVAVSFPLAEEVCAWCRAWGYGAICCPKCKAWCCYGKVTGKLAQCACGCEGRIGEGAAEAIGLVLRR